MNYHLWSPYIHLAMHSVMPPSHRLAQRVIFDYELVYVQKGSLTLTLDGIPHLCKEGDILLLRPGVPHIFDVHPDEPLHQPHIHFDLQYDALSAKIPVSFRDRDAMSREELAMIRPDVLPPGPLILPLVDSEQIYEQFLATVDTYVAEGNSLACKASLLRLLSLLFASESYSRAESSSRTNPRIAAIREYIDHNYQQALTLEQLEQLFHYSSCYITQAFRREYGIPVIRYHNQRRGQAARELLQEGRSVTAVSEMLGFSSVYAFSRFFRNLYEQSPTEYRTQGSKPACTNLKSSTIKEIFSS